MKELKSYDFTSMQNPMHKWANSSKIKDTKLIATENKLMIVHLFVYTKNYWTVHLKNMDFMVYVTF